MPRALPVLLSRRLVVRATDHRAYANLLEIPSGMDEYVGRGTITSASAERADEGTTFEAPCYTDPLALEHLTGSLSAIVAHVGTHHWPTPVSLRFTTKFDNVAPMLDLPHAGRTRVRMSVNAEPVAARFDGGTARLRQRIAALRTLALSGYPVGLTIAPVMPIPDWRESYSALLHHVAQALGDVADLDLTAECITHRFAANSKDVLLGWSPRTKLQMDESPRTRKFGKFDSAKYVYPKDTMTEMRDWFDKERAATLPAARALPDVTHAIGVSHPEGRATRYR